jgi:hypothetical protein
VGNVMSPPVLVLRLFEEVDEARWVFWKALYMVPELGLMVERAAVLLREQTP